jgi:hypothetical protein
MSEDFMRPYELALQREHYWVTVYEFLTKTGMYAPDAPKKKPPNLPANCPAHMRQP